MEQGSNQRGHSNRNNHNTPIFQQNQHQTSANTFNDRFNNQGHNHNIIRGNEQHHQTSFADDANNFLPQSSTNFNIQRPNQGFVRPGTPLRESHRGSTHFGSN